MKPHLRAMCAAIRAQEALLVDARPAKKNMIMRSDAVHTGPLKDGALPKALNVLLPSSASTPLYVFSSFEDPAPAVSASDALRAAGFTDVRTLEESFEALQAQCSTIETCG